MRRATSCRRRSCRRSRRGTRIKPALSSSPPMCRGWDTRLSTCRRARPPSLLSRLLLERRMSTRTSSIKSNWPPAGCAVSSTRRSRPKSWTPRNISVLRFSPCSQLGTAPGNSAGSSSRRWRALTGSAAMKLPGSTMRSNPDLLRPFFASRRSSRTRRSSKRLSSTTRRRGSIARSRFWIGTGLLTGNSAWLCRSTR